MTSMLDIVITRRVRLSVDTCCDEARNSEH